MNKVFHILNAVYVNTPLIWPELTLATITTLDDYIGSAATRTVLKAVSNTDHQLCNNVSYPRLDRR